MNLKDIAERIGVPLDKAQELVEEIQRQSEPVGTVREHREYDGFHNTEVMHICRVAKSIPVGTKLFTFPPDKTKIEQRVAEACADWVKWQRGTALGYNIAEGIRSGDWRKFVKGE